MAGVIGSTDISGSNASVIGSTEQSLNVNDVGVFATGEVVTQVSIYVAAAQTGDGVYEVGLYENADLSADPDGSLVWSKQVTVPDATAQGWLDIPISNEAITATNGNELGVAIGSRVSGGATTFKLGDNGVNRSRAASGASLPASWSETSTTAGDMAVTVTTAAAASLSIDEDPTEAQRGGTIEVAVSNASDEGLGTGDFSATLGGESLTIDGVVDDGGNSYTLTLGIPSAIALQHADHDLVITEDSVEATAENVSLTTPTGWAYVNLSGTIPASPLWETGNDWDEDDTVFLDEDIFVRDSNIVNSTTTPADGVDGWTFVRASENALDGYTGDAPVAGDQAVYEEADGDISFEVESDGNWIVTPPPPSNVEMDIYIIQADGTIGQTSTTTFSVEEDTTPDAFSFTTQSGVAVDTVIEFGPVTITGLTASAAISITDGEYAINLGAGFGTWRDTASTIPNNAQVKVRLTSASTALTSESGELTIGGVSAQFLAITAEETVDDTPRIIFTEPLVNSAAHPTNPGLLRADETDVSVTLLDSSGGLVTHTTRDTDSEGILGEVITADESVGDNLTCFIQFSDGDGVPPFSITVVDGT